MNERLSIRQCRIGVIDHDRLSGLESFLNQLHLPATSFPVVVQQILADMQVRCLKILVIERTLTRSLQSYEDNQFHCPIVPFGSKHQLALPRLKFYNKARRDKA